jgi:hypothetical protein
MRVIVCGSRGYGRADVIRARVRELPADALVIVGRARGADAVAEREASACGLDVAGYPAEWSKHGRRAGWLRNRVMLDVLLGGEDDARLVVAFWDGSSRGTLSMIRLARDAGITVEIWNQYGIRDE